MSLPKLTISMFGVCALVFALMGIWAGGAQGAATWLVLAANGTVSEGIGDPVTLEKDSAVYVLHSKISGAEVLFECTNIEAASVKLAATGKTAAGGKLIFHGCITKLNGVESKPCEPVNGGTEKGVLVTKPLHFELVLHILKNEKGEEIGKDELIEVVPDVAPTYLVFEEGKECSIGTKVSVIGKLFLKDCQNAFLTHLEKHLVEEGPLTKLFVISETAEHAATLLGSAWAKVKDSGGTFRSFAGHAG